MTNQKIQTREIQQQLDMMDKRQREDHDRLIRVETGIDAIHKQFSDMKSEVLKDITENTARIKSIESKHEGINAAELIEEFRDYKKRTDNIENKLKYTWMLISFGGGLIGYLANLILPNVVKMWFP